jgi:SPP1 family phage portal protein
VGEPIQHSFSRIPYFKLENAKDNTSDLYRIKPLIDVYDIINSDFANNIDDMQDAFLTLKGYSGNAENLNQFMKELKSLKVLAVSEDGEAGVHQLQIPTEARTVFLDRLKAEIYSAAMAVDLSAITSGGNDITNVVIKSLLMNLDLKTDQFENQVRKFMYSLIDFINTEDKKNIGYDFSFERSMIMNRMESVEMLLKLTGVLSQKTIRELLPYDIDLKEEEKRLEEETSPVTLMMPEENEEGEEGVMNEE